MTAILNKYSKYNVGSHSESYGNVELFRFFANIAYLNNIIKSK